MNSQNSQPVSEGALKMKQLTFLIFLFCDLRVISFSISVICFRMRVVVFSSSVGKEDFLSNFFFVITSESSPSLLVDSFSDAEAIPFDLP